MADEIESMREQLKVARSEAVFHRDRVEELEAAALRERAAIQELVEAARDVFRNEPDLDEDDAPGHCHVVPGVWDKSNGPAKGGMPCGLCQAWMRFRAALAKFDGGKGESGE